MSRRTPGSGMSSTRSDANLYLDLRSHRHALNRVSKQSAKYYGYRGVHPGWVNQPYLALRPDTIASFSDPCPRTAYASCAPTLRHPAHMHVSTWTKRDMWLDRERGIWPLDRRHHKGKKIREKYCWKYTEKELGRRMRVKTRGLEGAVSGAEIEARYGDDYYLCRFGDDDVEEEGYDDRDGDGGDDEEGEEGDVEEFIEDGASFVDEQELSEKETDVDNEDGFNIISERDFDVLSISSIEEDDGEGT
ncbi:uncharacterized protein Z518_06870 [Rhinocladiella mackenziei CBS 650.93]|uniref:Uncharacterized protein n=1 Tax=Rhinocladiella mackenziei CBS 650.93 TaxID=1442369 RepID=A0A0D2GYP8_9EURO|nr:uncharacterized protein Z518_06870 [Rhinocladiella mackenziei CBS 650.93]KIX03318.1 hypothetical protein Z518_06870 [Rhinocladiella mackenziei CBS 650.93]